MARRTELVDAIRDKIITGAFQPGMSVPEEALAAEFKVSRSPVREALIMLEGRALVSTETNRGFRVSSVSVEAIRNYFVAAKTILPVVAALAAQHASEDDFASLAQPDAPDAEPKASILKHFRYIQIMSRCSRNAFLASSAEMAEGYHCFVRSSVMKNVSRAVAEAAAKDLEMHEANVNHALKQGPGPTLDDAVDQMIEGSRVFLISHLV